MLTSRNFITSTLLWHQAAGAGLRQPTPLSAWCCQNSCNPSSCTSSTPGPHRGKPKSSRAASGANPSARPTCRSGTKTTIETQGSMAKEEDSKSSHQLYKLQIKSTRSTRQTLCGIYKKYILFLI